MNFVRYGSVFGESQTVLSDDLVVSSVDLAATIFDLVGADVPANYTTDGVSWLDEVMDAVDGTATSDGSCCEQKFIDIQNSRSIVTADYQYIWRANDDVESVGGVDDYYPHTYDEQQLYDLNADPDQKVNLVTDYESFRDDDADGTLSDAITSFQSTMRDYITSTCPIEDGGCDAPSYTFCTDVVTKNYWFFGIETLDDETTASLLEQSEEKFVEDEPDCMADGATTMNYWYTMVEANAAAVYSKVTVKMEVR